MSSVASQVADAAVTAIEGLSLTYGGTAFTVVRRKVPTLPHGTEPPVIVVTIGDEGDVEYLTGGRNLVKYPLGIAVIAAGGKTLADDEALRLVRQSIRQELDDKERVTFAGVTGFNRVTTGGRSPFAGAALPKDLNVGTLVFTAEVLETKAS